MVVEDSTTFESVKATIEAKLGGEVVFDRDCRPLGVLLGWKPNYRVLWKYDHNTTRPLKRVTIDGDLVHPYYLLGEGSSWYEAISAVEVLG